MECMFANKEAIQVKVLAVMSDANALEWIAETVRNFHCSVNIVGSSYYLDPVSYLGLLVL